MITCEEATNTIQPALVSRETMASYCDFAVLHSTQTTLSFPHIGYDKVFCDAGSVTEPDSSVPFCIEQIQHDDNAVRFYTGFPTYKILMACILMACFIFLGESVSNLVGKYYQSVGSKQGRPHTLSPLNEFL